jgi:hypothetical protein
MTFDETCGFCTGTVQKPLGRPQLSPALGPFLFAPKSNAALAEYIRRAALVSHQSPEIPPGALSSHLAPGPDTVPPPNRGHRELLVASDITGAWDAIRGFGRDILICSKIPIKKIYLQQITGLPFSALHHIRSL